MSSSSLLVCGRWAIVGCSEGCTPLQLYDAAMLHQLDSRRDEGSAFADRCLLLSSPLLLVLKTLDDLNRVFKKTHDYVNTFARFNEPETVQSVRG